MIKLTYPINKYYIQLVGKYAFSLANLFFHQSLAHWQKPVQRRGALVLILSFYSCMLLQSN